MKKLLLFLSLLALVNFAGAQELVDGSIRSSASSCQPQAVTSACVFLQVGPQTNSADITVRGTYSGTLQFEVSGDAGATWVSVNATPPNSSTAVTSTTSTGTWTASMAGHSFLRVRASAFASGVANVTLNPSQAVTAGTGGGSSGGGTTTNPLTMDASGSGAAAGSTFDGSSAKTISYNTVGACPASTTINPQTSSYVLLLTDACGYVRMNVTTTANTVTVPLNSSVAFPVGTNITVRQAGTGVTTIVATGGVTITTPSSLILRVQNSAVQLLKVATDTWDLMGDTQ
jgi:hypothetical protein